ncbi:MAG TPA: metallophosphoesterase [Candidatus Gracilibacteria bacterium]
MNYKTLALFSDINWGVLPRSFFYFEFLLWVILLGFPIFIFLLHRYQGLSLNKTLKYLYIVGCLLFSVLSFIWTSSIWIFLVGVLSIGFVWKLETITQRFKWPITFVLIFCLVCTIWGSYFESRMLVLREFDLDIEAFPTMRIVVVSDLHVGPYKKDAWVARVVKGINAIERVDGVFIPGDFVYGDSEYYAPFLKPLENIKAPLYVTLGNHDHHKDPEKNEHQAKYVNQNLEDLGILPMNNLSKYWEDKSLTIIGLDDNDLGYGDLDKALEGVDRAKPAILLTHSPDIMDEVGEYLIPDTSYLILSGHTHCGQLRIPGYGALPLTIPTVNGKKYEKHYYKEDNKHLFITCGVGEVGPRGRFFDPPEMVILNIN